MWAEIAFVLGLLIKNDLLAGLRNPEPGFWYNPDLEVLVQSGSEKPRILIRILADVW